MITPAQEAAVRQALGSTPGQMFSPSTTTQYTQYSPEKLEALKNALSAKKSGFETFANGLANAPQAQAFTGGFGEQIIDPWSAGLSSFARGFGNTYSEKAADAREAELKAAQLEAEADKKTITDQVKFDEKAAEKVESKKKQEELKAQQRDSARRALNELNALAVEGDITSGNKSVDDWWLTGKSSRNIGRREAALSALIPLTNAIAKESGGSGINTLGEMLAYVGMPENATSDQIEGALPGIAYKLGFERDETGQFRERNNKVNGFTIEEVK